MIKTIYRIHAPYSMNTWIEVYGDTENASYEWRIIDGEHTTKDTGTEGHRTLGRQYGQAEIALRDALIYASDT